MVLFTFYMLLTEHFKSSGNEKGSHPRGIFKSWSPQWSGQRHIWLSFQQNSEVSKQASTFQNETSHLCNFSVVLKGLNGIQSDSVALDTLSEQLWFFCHTDIAVHCVSILKEIFLLKIISKSNFFRKARGIKIMEFWQYDVFLSRSKLIKKGSLIMLKSSKAENETKHEGTSNSCRI